MTDKNSNIQISWAEICKRFFLAFIIFLVVIFMVMCSPSKDKKKSKQNLYQECYYYSQELVKDKLKSPKSSDFPWYSDNFISDKGNKIIVSAYVDADNSFGANVRVQYTATITVKDKEIVSGTVSLIE